MSAMNMLGMTPWSACIAGLPTARSRMYEGPAGYFSLGRLPTDALGRATLTVQGMPAGTDIVVLDAGTSNIIYQIDSAPGTSHDYTYNVYADNTVVDIGLINPGYEIFYVRNLTLPRTNAVLPVALRVDRSFA